MSTIRKRIESGFESFGHLVVNHKYKMLVLMLLIIAGFFSQVPKITMDTSSEGFLHESDPILKNYNQFREQFGRDELIVLTIKTADLFNQSILKKLQALHDEIENNVPHLDEVDSLINARHTRGEADKLIVEDLFENWPADAAALEVIKQRALASTLYQNFILSEDGSLTTIVIRTSAYSSVGAEQDIMQGFEDDDTTSQSSQPFLTDAENSETVQAVLKIIEKYQADDFQILAGGSPVVINQLKQAMQHDMQSFTRMALLIIAGVLYFLFRRASGVFLPLIVVILTLLSTVGLMAATGTAFKVPTQILPSLLLAVGVAASVHLLAIFYRHFHESADKKAAIAYALGHSGLAIVMTSLTTAAGLLSFATSQVAPIADLGRFAGAGVLISLIYTLVFLPTLIALLPIKHKGGKTDTANHPIMDNFLSWTAHFSTHHAKSIVAVSLVVIGVMLVSLLSIRFYHNPLIWMPTSWEARQATELLDQQMKGSGNLEVVINTRQENGLYDPELLNKIQGLHQSLTDLHVDEAYIGKTVSVVDIIKESNRALNENRESFYVIPQNRDLVAQELLLFENSGSDDLENFVDSQFSTARLTLKTNWVDASGANHLINAIDSQLQATLPELDSYITGMGTLFSRTLDAAIHSTRLSYLLAAMVITVMMIVLLSSVKMGLISMIPNLMPIIITLGIMAMLGVPLDMFTMLIGSIAIGLAVDDTIHFMHNFRRYYLDTGDVHEAVHRTLMSTGRAIVATTIVLCLGFLIFMAADLNNVFLFGALTGSTILLALIADLFLAPALVTLVYGQKKVIQPA